MAKTIHKNNKAKYLNELRKLRNKLNQDIDVQIRETIKEGEASKYAGYTFRFSPLNDNATKSNWTAKLHENGSFHTHFTVLGHMQAGAPDRLEIYKPEDDPDTDEPVRTIEFKITPPNLVINIGGSPSRSCPMTYDASLDDNTNKLDINFVYATYKDGRNRDNTLCIYYESEQLKGEHFYVDGKLQGIHKEYYESGQLYTEYPYVDGKLQGIQKAYYESGQLYSESPYVDDKLQGIQKAYYESGQLYTEYPYVDNIPQGIFKEYYESGQLSTESPYVDGKEHGLEKYYLTSGELASCYIWENGNYVGDCM